MKTFAKLLILVAGLGLAACDDNTTAPADMGGADLTTPDKPDLATPPDMFPACVMNPMTHVEIINACTNADPFDKTPFFPSLAPNGQLPPLP